MHPQKTYAFILGGAVLWCSALILAPVIAAWPAAPQWISSTLYQFFEPVCHQIDARSFHLFDFPLAVCTRCSSIYFAFLAGTALYPLFFDLRRHAMPPRILLILTVIPMILDAGGGLLGLHEVTPITRTATGALFGLAIPLFVIPGAIEGASQLFRTQPQKGTHDA
jgi:uncharacterized membrane protein